MERAPSSQSTPNLSSFLVCHERCGTALRAESSRYRKHVVLALIKIIK